MTENEFILQDRLTKIKSVVEQYGEDNFYISFSGGKDSTVLSELVDMAVPDNKIPRVYADTGIELNIVRKFVIDMSEHDERVVIIKPATPIKQMLETVGYPFKSKKHSQLVGTFQKNNCSLENLDGIKHYLRIHEDGKKWTKWSCCPDVLRYQFTSEFNLKLSDKCCNELKKKPLHQWQKENNKPYGIIGLMREEAGNRTNAKCIVFKSNGKMNFQPLSIVTKDWEEWFIKEYNVQICDIYNEPYNFYRTGCKGCPFILDLENQLEILEKFFPAERKQCEIIWKPVYDEYRRLGYRLKKNEPTEPEFEGQISFDDLLKGENYENN